MAQLPFLLKISDDLRINLFQITKVNRHAKIKGIGGSPMVVTIYFTGGSAETLTPEEAKDFLRYWDNQGEDVKNESTENVGEGARGGRFDNIMGGSS